MSEVDAARRRFAGRWGELREALESETGRRPRSRGWKMLLVAGAAGFALALWRRRGSGGRRRQLSG